MKHQFLPVDAVIDGRYRVLGVISTGSFGVVYRVHDREDDKEVALKTLHVIARGVPEHVARFHREARLGAQLDHPNIVPHLSSGELSQAQGGGPYLTLDLVHGLPLGDLVDARGRLSAEEAVHILGHVLDALDAVHNLGAIHRDLKPDNVLLAAPGGATEPIDPAGSIAARVGVPEADDATWADLTRSKVTLLDFGLGKFLPIEDREVEKITTTGMGAGTVHYMSPEQIQAKRDLDYRTDLYGAAMLLFRMLDGEPPYAGKMMIEVANQHLKSPPPALPEDLDNELLDGVYRRAARKKRDERYTSAAEMAWFLRAAVDPSLAAATPPTFSPPPPLRPTGFWSRLFGR